MCVCVCAIPAPYIMMCGLQSARLARPLCALGREMYDKKRNPKLESAAAAEAQADCRGAGVERGVCVVEGGGHTKCELKMYMTAEKAENINTSQAKQLPQWQHRHSFLPRSPLSTLSLLSLVSTLSESNNKLYAQEDNWVLYCPTTFMRKVQNDLRLC